MKKQIMSIAAAAALFTTGAMAFDAYRTTGIVGLETSSTKFKAAEMNTDNIVTEPTQIIVGAPGTTGDALIFPAYYSQKGWSTEFSVINNSSDEAVIAKVVLYSAVDSKELRDFNIYLSKNDVFRATIKDGKLISTDSSTRASAQDTVSEASLSLTGYRRKDSAPMASASKPFETTIDEAVGYIAVFAMAQADGDTSYDDVAGDYAEYHGKHNELWQDYRHMLDQCRGEGWRTTSNNYGGIFRTSQMSVPNVNLNHANDIIAEVAPQLEDDDTCGTVISTQHKTSKTRTRKVTFKSPTAVLSGSVLVKGDDSKGTRSMLLQATPILNFTDNAKDAGMLWTEGELANIADRCLEEGINTTAGDDVQYNAACLLRDASSFAINSTSYEFRDAENSQLLITQPYKRTILQIRDRASSTYSNYHSVLDGVNAYYKGVKRAKDSDDNLRNITYYGEFDLDQPYIYDDNENRSTNTSDGYIVSPAPIQASTPGIPNELSVFNPLGSYDDSTSGFARIKYNNYAHGIVTQMSVDTVGSTAEVNWIYPVTN